MKCVALWIAALAVALSCSCGKGNPAAAVAGAGDTVTSRASLLTIVERSGWVEVTVADPWNAGRRLGAYALVQRDSAADFPAGYERVDVPLRRSIVYSGVHTSAIAGLGATGAIAGVADGTYLPEGDPLRRLVAAGRVRDIGSSMSPSVEDAIDLSPDAVLLSPFENQATGGIEKAGAPLVYMADYMENSPTGRAEWLLLLGYLYGHPDEAMTACEGVCSRYDSIAAEARRRTDRPRVFTERPSSGVWYVPGGSSYMARLLADAGADYLWSDNSGTGSVPLDEAAVIDRAADADFWLLKEYAPMSAERLRAEVPHAAMFKAFPRGVRVCDTRGTTFVNDLAFRPDLILRDLAAVFRGAGADSTVYFKPLP